MSCSGSGAPVQAAVSHQYYLNLIFWIGFSSLIYEIYSTKVLFLFFLESSQAVTLAITAFLAGLAFSSLWFSGLAKQSALNNMRILWGMQLAVILYAYFILKNYALIPELIDWLKARISSPAGLNFAKIAIIWLYLFIPAFFIGGSFPLINGLYLNGRQEQTQGTGLVYFWDTLGAIAGAFLAGFCLLPQLGFRATVIIAMSVNLCIAIVIAPGKWLRTLLVVLALAMLGGEASSYASHRKAEQRQEAGNSAYPEYPELDSIFGKILFQQMSPFGRITIGADAFDEKGNKALFVNYRDMCRSSQHESEAGIGALVAARSPENSRILSIGFGCGFTAKAIAGARKVAKLDIAEINRTIVAGAAQHFSKENDDVLNNPKTTLHIIDGAEYLRDTKVLYDAIVVDIEEATIIYSSPLYSKEYFQIAKQRMKAEGVFGLWAFDGDPDFQKVLYNTLKAVYKHVSLIRIEGKYTYYASDSSLNLPVSRAGSHPGPQEMQDTKVLLSTPNVEINTLDNNVLGKYFRVRQVFNLPLGYSEAFLRE